MSRLLVASTFVVLAALAPRVEARAGEGGPYRVVRGGQVALGVSEEVGDLLAVDAEVELAGVVRGHVYAVDSAVVVRSSAVVLRSLTLQRGTLTVEDGAVLPEALTLAGTVVRGRDGRPIPVATGRAPLGRGGSLVTLDVVPASSSTAVALMKSVLPFDRFAPSDARSVPELAAWDPGLGLAKVKDEVAPRAITIANLARLSLESARVEGAFQRGYRGARGSVLFSGLKLADEAAARALWAELEQAVPSSKVALSVKTGLGGGAHWYFKRKGRHDLLWQRGPWVLAVETKLAAEHATTVQERQFSDQVLGGLRTALDAMESRSTRRATPKRTVEGAKR